jgi:hypothetical protein
LRTNQTLHIKTHVHLFVHLEIICYKYLQEVETKFVVSMFRVCLNINTKTMRNGFAIRIFPNTTRTFTKDKAPSEHGSGTARLCVNWRDTAWPGHGRDTATYV